MTDSRTLTTCPSCAEEVQPEAVRCKHCGHSLVGEGWLEDVRSYARMTPQERLDWMRSLSPEKGRRFREIWKVFGPEAERQPPSYAGAVSPPQPKSVETDRRRRNAVLIGGLALLLLVLFLAFMDDPWTAGGGTLLLALGALAYLLPLLIAAKREHHQVGAIAVINIFLGWTFLGWVIAFAMACSAVKTPPTAGPGQS